MPKIDSNPPIFTDKPMDNLPERLRFNKPAAPNPTPTGTLSLLVPFTDPLLGIVEKNASSTDSMAADISAKNDSINSLNDLRNQLGEAVTAGKLVWEGPTVIDGWPTDVDAQIRATKLLEIGLGQIGKTLDPSLKDKLTYKEQNGQRIIVDRTSVFAQGNPPAYDRETVLRARGIFRSNYEGWSDESLINAFVTPAPCYVFFPNGKLYQVYNDTSANQFRKTEVSEFISDVRQVSLQLYGDQFVAETKRLKDAGLRTAQCDGFQYTTGGKVGYTAVNQILTRSSADFSGVPDRTIVAVDTNYYIVNGGKGQLLAGPPLSVLMGLPANAEPPGETRYNAAIISTLDLVQRGTSIAPGDYDMGKYYFSGGQVGYAKMPPVVVNADPRIDGSASYAPGTLLQYTDSQNNVSYYRVTGTGVAKVEDPSNFATAVKGTPPDLSSIDPGTLVKLDDGKVYWVTKDKKTLPADGAPIMRFMSPEQRGKWSSVELTEALEVGGIELSGSDTDACRYLDKNNNTVYAKLPTKTFDGPGTQPSGKDYAPGDVVEDKAGTMVWYIDADGKAQEARSPIKLAAENLAPDFDPSKFNPGDVVSTENGKYFRITADHQKVSTSYPLQKLVLNPSDRQIEAIKSKITDLQNAKGSDLKGLTTKLQLLMSDRTTLFAMISSLLTALHGAYTGIARNINA